MISIDYSLAMQSNVSGGISSSALSALGDRLKCELFPILEKKLADGTYAFREALQDSRIQLPRIMDYIHHAQQEFDNFVVVGIGGSNLGNMVVDSAFIGNGKKLFYLDNIEPYRIAHLLRSLDLKRTLFNIITKSGATSETMANYIVAKKALQEQGLPIARHFVYTTDPEQGYLQKVRQHDNVPTFTIPPKLGGRFSVLSPVGLLSSAFKGIDMSAMLDGAEAMAKRCATPDINTNPGLLLAALYVAAYEQGKNINVIMPYSDRLGQFGKWFCQLWAESLGKFTEKGKRIGQTPVAALGTVDQHSQVQLYMEGPDDKIITFIKINEVADDLPLDGEIDYLNGVTMGQLLNAELHATEMALLKQQKASLRLDIDQLNAATMGELFYLFMYATVVAGEILGVNPIDQPGVEEGKQFTYGLLGRKEYAGKLDEYTTLENSFTRYAL